MDKLVYIFSLFKPLKFLTCSLEQSTPVFSVYTTLPTKIRPERLWMCFHEQSQKQKNKASRYLRRQKTHFRQAAYHLKALYSSRFSGTYLFFTFVINTTHST